MNARISGLVLLTALFAFHADAAQQNWETRELPDSALDVLAARSPDLGIASPSLPGLDGSDTITARSSLGDATFIGTATGDLVEIVDGNPFRVQLCKWAVTSVTQAFADASVFASCGNTVYVREQETSAWRHLAGDLRGTVRSVVADPFAPAVFIGTSTATFRVENGVTEEVAGPSSDLRVVHFPTHTTVAGNFNGRVSTLATTTGCSIGIFDLSGRYNTSRSALHYGYVYRTSVRVSSENCRWSIDIPGAPSWMNFRHPGGPTWKRTRIDQLGSNDIEVIVARNTGLARSGSFTLSVGDAKVKSTVTQHQRTGVCMHTPRSTDKDTLAAYLEEGEFAILTRYFGKIVPGNSGQGPRVNFRIEDASRCHAEPIVFAVTPALVGSVITAVGYRPPTPSLVVVSTPLPPAKESGELLVTTLRGNGGVGPSSIVTVLLKELSELPADLRNSGPGKPTILVFDNGGGRIDLDGTVKRQTSDPKRRCAFDSSLYRVVGGNWLAVSATDSGCNSKSPDMGKLVITAQPNVHGTRYAAIYTPWGFTAIIVQR